MKRLFLILVALVAVWGLGSFLGVMLDPARASLWTQSLLWAMLASIVLAPVLLFIGTSSESSPSPPQAEQPFEIDESTGVEQHEPHEEEEWPYTSEQEETNPGGSSAVN